VIHPDEAAIEQTLPLVSVGLEKYCAPGGATHVPTITARLSEAVITGLADLNPRDVDYCG
jgi:hypothetical protein